MLFLFIVQCQNFFLLEKDGKLDLSEIELMRRQAPLRRILSAMARCNNR